MKYPKLKAKRVELGLTQLDMANKMGITLSTYNLKEQGKREFLSSEIIKILDIFKCAYEDNFLR